jgi:hypothetical protein
VQRKRQAWQKSLHTLTAALQARTADPNNPVRIHLGMTGSDVQKSAEGCHIFALSAAKKMADEPSIQTLHERVLLGLHTGRIAAGVNHLDAQRNLPPSMFKHATSKTVLQRYIQASDERRLAAQAKKTTASPVGSACAPMHRPRSTKRANPWWNAMPPTWLPGQTGENRGDS